jgi:hypothetical protein
MSDTTISALPAATAIVPASDVLPIDTTIATVATTAKTTPAQLVNAALLAPGPIGSGTPGTGAFTTLSATSTVSGAGFSAYLASPPAVGGTAPAAGTFTTLVAAKYQMATGAILTESTTTRTLSATDNGAVIYCTSGSATTITTAAGLGAGFSCTIIQGGAGQVGLAQGSSTTLVSYGSLVKSAGQYAMMSIICPVADTFYLGGNLGA